MEETLKYISLITVTGAAISFVIGLIKWIDQRNREQKQKEYEAFHKMVCIASGINQEGNVVKMVQQIAAIYQLQAYSQYSFASIPVLQLMQFEYSQTSDNRSEFMEKALSETLNVLQSKH